MSGKIYIKADDLLRDSQTLAASVAKSGFRPDAILSLWRGGAPIGVAITQYLENALDYSPISQAVRTSAYHDDKLRDGAVTIFGLDGFTNRLTPSSTVLIVDDIFDTGLTMQAVREGLMQAGVKQAHIKTLVPWFKPAANQTPITPDYYLHTTKDWVVFPYSIEGLSADEIKSHLPDIYALLKDVL